MTSSQHLVRGFDRATAVDGTIIDAGIVEQGEVAGKRASRSPAVRPNAGEVAMSRRSVLNRRGA